MSKRIRKSLKINSSDGDVFEVNDEVVKRMKTLKAMTILDVSGSHRLIIILRGPVLLSIMLGQKVGECFQEVLSLFVSIFLMNTAKMHFQLDFFDLMKTSCTSGGQVLMIIMRS